MRAPPILSPLVPSEDYCLAVIPPPDLVVFQGVVRKGLVSERIPDVGIIQRNAYVLLQNREPEVLPAPEAPEHGEARVFGNVIVREGTT